jgi:hypothetical protein
MSLFVGAARPTTILTGNEWRLEPIFWSNEIREGSLGYYSPWWPRPGFIGDLAVDVGLIEATWFELPEITRGTNTRYGIAGVTRDVYGSALGGVLVKLFLLSTDVKVDQIVSDPLGNFLVSTPFYPDDHYLVEYKAGSPDVFGSSVNTLIGA